MPRHQLLHASRAIVVILIAGFLAACATAKGSLPQLPPAPVAEAGLPPEIPPYRIQIGDVLDIKLLQNPELNEEVTIRPDGMLSTAVAEDVSAAGHTPAELSAALRERYHSDLMNPRISVVVHSFAPNRIYVAGEVASPGEFITVGPNLTINQAIARAGGVKLTGDRNRIFVIRRGVDDVPHAYAVDFKGIISGQSPASDARLAPYDVVYVPRTGVFEVFTFWNQFVQQFMPVNWGFSYNINPIATQR